MAGEGAASEGAARRDGGRGLMKANAIQGGEMKTCFIVLALCLCLAGTTTRAELTEEQSAYANGDDVAALQDRFQNTFTFDSGSC